MIEVLRITKSAKERIKEQYERDKKIDERNLVKKPSQTRVLIEEIMKNIFM